MTVRIRGTISVPKLTRSLQRLAERHDALRASFDETGSVMRIAPRVHLEVPVSDLSEVIRESKSEESLQKLCVEDAAQPFVLPDGPLFRCRIVLMGEADSAAVIFTGHHVICDGWSIDVLIHDLCAIYSEEISGESSGLGPAPSFADYVTEYGNASFGGVRGGKGVLEEEIR